MTIARTRRGRAVVASRQDVRFNRNEEAIGVMPREDSELRARLLARLGAGPLKLQGDASRPRRFELSAEAVAMARRLDDPAVLAWTLDGRKVAIWGPDTLEEHLAVIEEMRELAENAGDPEQLVDVAS